MKKIIVILFLSFLLFSCWIKNKQESKINNKQEISSNNNKQEISSGDIITSSWNIELDSQEEKMLDDLLKF